MMTTIDPTSYTPSMVSYQRRSTIDVRVGDLMLGSAYPIRLQSMTTTDTMDTEGTIAQSIRMIEAGCELVRVTAPSMREARNLEAIRQGLRDRGYTAPLVADIHYTPNAAEVAARLVEKVRINPGNYVDKKQFATIEYDDASYAAELDRIRARFVPLIRICKEYGTAMRIGTNHGSLSDRIMSRYGDNPAGMVESALEFLRIANDEGYDNIVLSMKSSNPLVMVEAYRLLVAQLQAEGLKPYPLHLGVTEAGDGDDGRVKSALGIGTLLEDGLGDTVRVSLTEEPEAELPVARRLVERYTARPTARTITPITVLPHDPFRYERRRTVPVASIGGDHVPRVIADLSAVADRSVDVLAAVGHHYHADTDKWSMTDQGCDFLYTGKRPLPYMAPNGCRQIVDADVWATLDERFFTVPLFSTSAWGSAAERHSVMNVVALDADQCTDVAVIDTLRDPSVVILLQCHDIHWMPTMRRAIIHLVEYGLRAPVIVHRPLPDADADTIVLGAATDVGGLFVDGYGDGVMLSPSIGSGAGYDRLALANRLAFGILQAARTRMTKTEYISCPSCGRTLFDLQETTAMIRQHTDHLKGLKIGIMGCIVNGPGEMADADYGYVGSGPDRITLYRGQTIVQRNIPSNEALPALIDIIRGDGRWVEPGVGQPTATTA